MNAQKNVVLLTATIRPPADAVALARSDVAVRLQDYREAFAFYLSLLADNVIDGLVLCDNSNHDLGMFQRMTDERGLQSRVNLLAFAGLDHSSRKGRGYGEFKLVDHAVAHSALLSDSAATVWKVTGRYRVLNLRRIIESKPGHADLYCNSRNHPARWTDMYLMAWSQVGYEAFIRNVYLKLGEDDQLNSEELFREWLDQHNVTTGIVQRFRAVPKLVGRRGDDNSEYADMNLKHVARVVANRVMPWLWI